MTYIVTLFNKKKYISSVVNSLVKEGGGHPREYIFVDDGSTDGSILILKNLIRKLPGKVKIISRRNMGASYSTNEAVTTTSSISSSLSTFCAKVSCTATMLANTST